MNTYILTLLDTYIEDDNIASKLFKKVVLHAKSCKQLVKKLACELDADDYELRYFKSMKSFYLRLIYNRKKRVILVTYHIIALPGSNKLPYLANSYLSKIK